MDINETSANTETELNENKIVRRETYDPIKIGGIKKMLEMQVQRGQPYFYKIIMDNMEIVGKTTDLEKFDTHENFLDGAGEITIILYGTAAETRRIKSKRIFVINPETPRPPTAQELYGLETESRIEEKLRKHFEMEQLRKENQEKDNKLADAEDYIDELEKGMEKLRHENILLEKGLVVKDKSYGAILSGGLEGFLRNNPHFIAKMGPGGAALAGLIEQDNQDKEKAEKTTHTPEATEASFTELVPALTEDEQQLLDFIKEMAKRFGERLWDDVMDILEHLSTHTNDVKIVAQLLELKKG